METFDWILSSKDEGDIEVNGSLTIGRGEESDICIPDFSVSRKHAVLTLTDSGPVLTDLGSANGTLVNGHKISEPVVLRHNDQINLHARVYKVQKLPAIQTPENVLRSAQYGEFTLKGEMTIGRDPACDIHLAEDIISRKHARILVTRAGAIIEDFGSANGTYLNGKRIVNRMKLVPGDHLKICDKVFHVAPKVDPEATRIVGLNDDPEATVVVTDVVADVVTETVDPDATCSSPVIKEKASTVAQKIIEASQASESILPNVLPKTEVFKRGESTSSGMRRRPSAIQRQQNQNQQKGQALIHKLTKGTSVEFTFSDGQARQYFLKEIDWKEDVYSFEVNSKFSLKARKQGVAIQKSRDELIRDLESGVISILAERTKRSRLKTFVGRVR